MTHRFLDFDHIPEVEIMPGFHARMIHGDAVSVIRFRIEAGSVLKEHFHVHEQVTNVLAGQLELKVSGETRILGPGQSVVIPSNVPHSGKALTDCLVLDVFQPVRADYARMG